MQWKPIDVVEGQEFLLTREYLTQCHELLPNDYRIYAYNELREALERIDWHLFMTLTFDNPIYDLHQASSYASEFIKLYRDRRLGRRKEKIPFFTVIETSKDPKHQRDHFHIHTLIGHPNGCRPKPFDFEALKRSHHKRSWQTVCLKLLSRLEIATDVDRETKAGQFDILEVMNLQATADYMLKGMKRNNLILCGEATNIDFKSGAIQRLLGGDRRTQRLSHSAFVRKAL